MNIRDIAKRAGVSTATVSRTVNGMSTVDPMLADRVWKAVEELGYYPNTQARALVSGRTSTFGLIVSAITNPFFPEIIQVFENLAVEHGYEILLSSTVNDPARMQASVRRMIERRVDGVAVMTFAMEQSLLNGLKLRNVPIVSVDIDTARPRVSSIRIDYAHGIREGVRHVCDLGHRRIAFISGPADLKSAAARTDAFRSSMKEAGLRILPGQLAVGDHTSDGGRRALQSLLALKDKPTAVLCSNDLTAFGVMRAAYDVGLQIPKDLSVVGFDDISLAQYVLPPLTTVQMSQAELARLAFTALLTEIQEPDASGKGREYVLTTKLVVRDSTTELGQHDRHSLVRRALK